jgi:hypothetical protein
VANCYANRSRLKISDYLLVRRIYLRDGARSDGDGVQLPSDPDEAVSSDDAPAILPDILTACKVNLGNASRVVVVAELVGATGGVGYQLLQQQQLFDMAGALAWTLQLVFFVLLVQGGLTLIENTVFRYRAVSERAI